MNIRVVTIALSHNSNGIYIWGAVAIIFSLITLFYFMTRDKYKGMPPSALAHVKQNFEKIPSEKRLMIELHKRKVQRAIEEATITPEKIARLASTVVLADMSSIKNPRNY